MPVPGRPDRLATVTATGDGQTTIEVPRLSVRPGGTGDLLSGLVAARLALGVPLPAAVARAVAGVGAALALTSDRPWAEMPVAAALRAIVEA